MANSIVFQSQPAQLKASVYGFDEENNQYLPLKVTPSGRLAIGGASLNISKIGSITGTVKVDIVNREFYSNVVTLTLAKSNTTVTNVSALFTVGNYQDVTYYVQNVSTTKEDEILIQMQATPSQTLASYPLASINTTATLYATIPLLLTTDYYMKYNAIKAVASSATALQTIQIVINARY